MGCSTIVDLLVGLIYSPAEEMAWLASIGFVYFILCFTCDSSVLGSNSYCDQLDGGPASIGFLYFICCFPCDKSVGGSNSN